MTNNEPTIKVLLRLISNSILLMTFISIVLTILSYCAKVYAGVGNRPVKIVRAVQYRSICRPVIE